MNAKKYPTIEEAKKIWQEGVEYRRKYFPNKPLSDEYAFHTYGVAETAQKIAKKIKSLNSEKAYVLGLLHDYGKRIREKEEGRFHGQEGYEAMMLMGYNDVAKICLTHTFPDKNFDIKTFGYREDWMLWVKDKLKHIEYDDYDRLIQLCDKFFEEKDITTIEKRVEGIVKRYGLSLVHKERLLNEGKVLKDYFDKLCEIDIYKLIGIKN